MAVVPPAALVDRIAALDRPVRPGLRWTPAGQWHVTLQFFAAVDPTALVGALDGLPTLGLGPVAVAVGPRPVALSRQTWVLPVSGLERLAGAVASLTAGLGPVEDRPFRGHLTLARARRPGGLRGLPAPELSMEWVADEVVAFSSVLHSDGAEHRLIGRQALR